MSVLRDTIEWLECAKKRPTSKEEILKNIKDIRGFIDEELDELEDAVKIDDEKGKINALLDAEWCLHNLNWLLNTTQESYDAEAERVKSSNYSKFCKSLEEAEHSVSLYREGIHPNKPGVKILAYAVQTGNAKYPFVLLRIGDDKVLKSHNFKDVDQF